MKNKIANIFIVISCWLFFLVRGKADKKIKIDKIIVIQMAKLGDMVCTTPMFRAIKDRYPGSELIVIGNKINKELLEHNPHIDSYISFDKGVLKLVKIIKGIKPDIVLITGPIFNLLAASFLANVPMIVAPDVLGGRCQFNTKSYRLCLKLVISKEHKMKCYAPREYLRLLEPIGVFTDDTEKYLGHSGDNMEVKNAVVIAPSAGNKLKIWGSKRFAELADLICANGKNVFVVGSGSDQKYVDEMMKNVSHESKIKNVCNKLSINEVKSLISKSDFFIGADTGLIYIAEAFKIPTIDITGPVDENEQPPTGKNHEVIFNNVWCRPCSFVMSTNRKCYNKEEPLACFNVSPEQVYKLYLEMIRT